MTILMSGLHLQKFDLGLELNFMEIEVQKEGVVIRSSLIRVEHDVFTKEPIEAWFQNSLLSLFLSVMSPASTIRPSISSTSNWHTQQVIIIRPISEILHRASSWVGWTIILVSPKRMVLKSPVKHQGILWFWKVYCKLFHKFLLDM